MSCTACVYVATLGKHSECRYHRNLTAQRGLPSRLKLAAEVAQLRARLARYEEALRWYADPATWGNAECDKLNAEGGFFPYGLDECPIAQDRGHRAREALSSGADGKGEGDE
jgi:hypothetical protein